MRYYPVYFLLVSILLLSGCGKKIVPTAPVSEKPAQHVTAVQDENLPMSRAEIAHLVNSSLLQTGCRYAQAALRGKNFITPAEFRDRENPVAPADAKKHPMLQDIKNILSCNFRGLTVDGNNVFRPDDSLSRARFALLVEDILGLGIGDSGLSTRYIGTNSPFADVNDGYFALNAIITVTSKNIMSADGKYFRPEDPVTRKEAKEAITVLQQLP